MKNLKLIILLLIIVLFSAFLGWENYMRATWDNHLLSDPPSAFSIKGINSDKYGKELEEWELDLLPEIYKRPLEIIKKGDDYIWVSNENQILRKAVTYTTYIKHNKNFGMKWIIFSDEAESVKITIQGNRYMQYWGYIGEYGCHPRLFWNGNSSIEYQLDDGRTLKAIVTVNVFENFRQYRACKYHKIKVIK